MVGPRFRDPQVQARKDGSRRKRDDEGVDPGHSNQNAAQQAAKHTDGDSQRQRDRQRQPQISSIAPNRIATRPPSAPSARFICPTASTMDCDSATSIDTDALRNITYTLKSVAKFGSNREARRGCRRYQDETGPIGGEETIAGQSPRPPSNPP